MGGSGGRGSLMGWGLFQLRLQGDEERLLGRHWGGGGICLRRNGSSKGPLGRAWWDGVLAGQKQGENAPNNTGMGILGGEGACLPWTAWGLQWWEVWLEMTGLRHAQIGLWSLLCLKAPNWQLGSKKPVLGESCQEICGALARALLTWREEWQQGAWDGGRGHYLSSTYVCNGYNIC